MVVDNLLLYKNDDLLLRRFSSILKDKRADDNEIFDLLSMLIKFGAEHGFYGNLWHCYITYMMVYDENPYSIDCEIKGNPGGTFDKIALHDYAILKELFDLNN